MVAELAIPSHDMLTSSHAGVVEKKGMGAGKTGPDLKDAVPEDRAALTTLGVKSCDSVSPPKSKFTRLEITS